MDKEVGLRLHGFSSNAAWLLSCLYGEKIPVSEEVVSLAKDPFYLKRATALVGEDKAERYLEDMERFHNLAAILRTGGIFRFSEDDVPWQDMHELLADERRELPPCPFPRMWFEVVSDLQTAVFTDVDGTRNVLLGFAVIEKTPCVEWVVLMPMLDLQLALDMRDRGEIQDNEEDMARATAVREWELIVLDGKMHIKVAESDIKAFETMKESWRKWWHGLLLPLPEFLTHLIHVLGVEVRPQSVSRPERRRFQRRMGFSFPQAYEVSLRSAGEPRVPGTSERTFVHRWLVRGHYRSNASGAFLLPERGPCSWVRPYIKGPPGAPWKGRPIHVSTES